MSEKTRQPIIVDTGPLVALIDADDQHHDRCTAWLRKILAERRTLVVPVPTITEVCYLLSRAAGAEAEARFLEELARAQGAFRLWSPGRASLERMAQLARKYSDMPLGVADAAVVAAAEAFGTTEVATIDMRLVGTVRLNNRDAILSVL